MAYTDYISSSTFDANDPTNPMWYQPLQYIPFQYKGINVDTRLGLLKPKEKPTMPDLSKFKEKLDKDLLPDEKKGVFEKFNKLEREIREELQSNPYALSNNPYLIQKFNELITMYNSGELQSLIDKKNFVKATVDKAVANGDTGKLAYDPQLKEYTHQTIGQIANGALNLEGNQTYAHVLFNFNSKDRKFGDINIPNVGNGNENDFTNELQKVYSKIEKDGQKTGSKRGTITYVDAFGNATNPAYAEGYVKNIKGGRGGLEQNYQNLLSNSLYLINNKNRLQNILGDKAYEGFNQLVHKTLSEGNAFTQYINLDKIYQDIEKDYKYLLNKEKQQPLQENRYKSFYTEKMKPIIDEIKKDESLSKALSNTSIQQIIYDMKVLNSGNIKNNEAKMNVIKKNPVLRYIFALQESSTAGKELADKYTKYIEQLNLLTKNTVEDAVLSQNVAFNTLLNRTYSTEIFTESDQSVGGNAYGGGFKPKEPEVRSSDFQDVVNGLASEKDLKERTISAEDYIGNIMQMAQANGKKITREDAMKIAANDAAISDLLRNNDKYNMLLAYKNETNPKKKEELKLMLEDKIKQEQKTIFGKNVNAIKSIKELETRLSAELSDVSSNNFKKLQSGEHLKDGTFNFNVKEVRVLPGTTQGGLEAKRYQLVANGEKEVSLSAIPQDANTSLFVNGKEINYEKYRNAIVDNSVNSGQLTQIQSPTLGNLNVGVVQRSLYVPSDNIDEFKKEYNINTSNLPEVTIGNKTYKVVQVSNVPTDDNKKNATRIDVGTVGKQTNKETVYKYGANTPQIESLEGTQNFQEELNRLLNPKE